MSVLINPLSVIRELSNSDKKLVKKAYYKKFPKESQNRFKECMWSGKTEFSAIEKNFLLKLFVQVDGVWVLDYSDAAMEFYS